jgi:hypothetical protein
MARWEKAPVPGASPEQLRRYHSGRYGAAEGAIGSESEGENPAKFSMPNPAEDMTDVIKAREERLKRATKVSF